MSKRLMRDIATFQKAEHKDIFIYYDESNMQDIYALFIGPIDTPFQGGFFYFHMDMRPFPASPPKVKFLTPQTSDFRIHPNLYQAPSGKVCLSLLGTWGGNTWSPLISIEKILITIQALLDNNPLAHEPGFTNSLISSNDSKNYAIMSRYLTMISIPMMMKRKDIPTPLREKMVNYLAQQFSLPNNVYTKSWKILDDYEGKQIKTMHNNKTISNYRFNLRDIV